MTTPPVVSITDELIEELEAAANAATPGRWRTDGDTWICAKDSDQLNNGFVLAICQGPDENKNAAYMAKASASVILALLAERADLKRQLAAASVDAERWRYARDLLHPDEIRDFQLALVSFGMKPTEDISQQCDAAIDVARNIAGDD